MTIKVKVDEKSKSAENEKTVKKQTQPEETPPMEDEKPGDHIFIRKDKDGRMFLLPETSSQLEKMLESRERLESELRLLILQEKNKDLEKEVLSLKAQILDREINDLKTAKGFKMEQKRRENLKHADYMDKVRKEVGRKDFSLSEEDEIIIGATEK